MSREASPQAASRGKHASSDHALRRPPAPSLWGKAKVAGPPSPKAFARVLPRATPQAGRQSRDFSRNTFSQNPLHFFISGRSVNKSTVLR